MSAAASCPLIHRYTVRSPFDGDAPQRRVNLTAQRALGRLLDRRVWWAAPVDEADLEEFLVRTHIEEALAVWKEAHAIDWTYLSERAPSAVTRPLGDERHLAVNKIFQEMVHVVQSSWYFCVGMEDPDDPNSAWDNQWDDENASTSDENDDADEGEDDSGDEFALDNDGNVVAFDVALNEARQWLCDHGFRGRWGEKEEEEEDGDESMEEDADESMEEAPYESMVDVDEDDYNEARLHSEPYCGNVGEREEEVEDNETEHMEEEHDDDDYERLEDEDRDSEVDGSEELGDNASELNESRRGQENSFGHVAWFVCLLMTRERLLELTPERATDANVREILRRGPTRSNAAVITRTLSFIRAWLHIADPIVPTTLDAMVPTCVPDTYSRVLHFHLMTIRRFIQETIEDVATTLRIVVESLGLQSDELAPVPGPIALTWMSDASLSDGHKAALLEHLAELRRQVDDIQSDHTAMLVDPELYGVVASRTKYNRTSDSGMALYGSPTAQMRGIMGVPSSALSAVPPLYNSSVARTRWLPSEVQFEHATGKAKLLSYINNLHPTNHAGLYKPIENILTQLLPLLENVLSSLDTNADMRTLKALYDHCQYSLPRAPRLVPRGLFDNRNVQFPLRGTQCRIVVRVSEIQLTPRTPRFVGSAWQCEGDDADGIVATGMYFYSVENVSAPQLAFRTFVQYPNHTPDDDVTLGLEYGLQSQGVLAQGLGHVTALEGRSIVFPNLYQHRIEPFRLTDRTKPGTLGMVSVMLVTPSALGFVANPAISTAMVPPQQSDWIQQERDALLTSLKLPEVVEALVREFSRDGIELEDAKRERDARLENLRPRPMDESSFLWYHRSDQYRPVMA